MRKLTYLLSLPLAFSALFAFDAHAQVALTEAAPQTLTNLSSPCDIGNSNSGDFQVNFPASNYNNAIHVAFGIKDEVNALFSSDQADPKQDDYTFSSGDPLELTFDYQIITASGAVLYPTGNTPTQVSLRIDPDGQTFNQLKYVDFLTVEHIPTGNYTVKLENVSISQNCNSFPAESIVKVFKTAKLYSATPHFVSGSNLSVAFDNPTTQANVVFNLPELEAGHGSGIDLEWVNLEDPLAGLDPINLDGIPSNAYDDLLAGSILPTEARFRSATRVNLESEDTYIIPNLFKRGYILARCRAVDYAPDGKRIEGPWVITPALGVESTFEQQVNWQSQSSYIESGKHKDVVSYFDGSQRGRQVVTKLESLKKAVVGETHYDFQGRAAINPIPVPDLDHDGLNLRSEFNRFVDGPIRPQAFDTKSKDSGINTRDGMLPLSSNFGAGKYYSDNNTLEPDVPFSQGYAYTKTLFKNDGTDRPVEVSSVGEGLTLQSGRTTRYYYGVPFQEELDRLFGNNAGDASKYKKNFTRDANHQLSVSYINQAGQVVATALSQDSPSNLDDISTAEDQVELSISLLSGKEEDKEIQEVDEYGFTFTQSFTSTTPGVQVFSYQMKAFDGSDLSTAVNYCSEIGTPPLAFGVEDAFAPVQQGHLESSDFNIYPPDQVLKDKNTVSPTANQTEIQNGCTDCKYNVFIGLIDPDGYAVKCFVGASAISEEVNFTNKTSAEINQKLLEFNANLPEIGTYTLVKVLSIDEDELEFKNRINRALLTFKPEVAFANPVSYDETCLGYYTYITRLQDTDGDGVGDTRFSEQGEVLDPMTPSELNAYISQACTEQSIKEDDEIDNGLCLQSIDEFLADVSPGGQYFDNTPDQKIYVSETLQDNPNYDKDGWLNRGILGEYTMPVSGHLEAVNPNNSGLLPYVKHLILDEMSPSDPWYFQFNTWDDLRAHWQPEFAHILLPFHPEFLAMVYNCRASYIPQMDEEACRLKEHGVLFEGFLHYRTENKKLSRLGNLGLRLDGADAYNVYMPDYHENALYKHKFSGVLGEAEAISKGYFNPLGLSTSDYPQASLLPSSNVGVDPYFESLTGNKAWIKDRVHDFLMNFTPRNDGTADNMSIYELLEYDLDIAQVDAACGGTAPTSLAQIKEVLDNCGSCSQTQKEALSMALYHYPEIGYITRTNKFQFFKSIYLSYRDFAQYAVFKVLGDGGSKYVSSNSLVTYTSTEDPLCSWNSPVTSSVSAHFDLGPYVNYPTYYMPKYHRDTYAGYNNGANCAIQGLYPVIELERTSVSNQGYQSCNEHLANRVVQNIDGTLSYYSHNETYMGNVVMQHPIYGNFEPNPDPAVRKSAQIKRNAGFTFRYPTIPFNEAMEEATDNQEMLDILDELLADDNQNLDLQYAEFCESRKTELAYLLLVDDERHTTSVIPSTTSFSELEEDMYFYCMDKRAQYFNKQEADAALSTQLGYTYTTHTAHPNDIFNLEGGLTDEALGYQLAVQRIKDVECACGVFNSDYITYGNNGGTVSTANLATYYLYNDILNLPISASTDVTNKLTNWKTTCEKSVYKPKDLFDLVLESYSGYSYDPMETFTESYLDFVDNHGGKDNVHPVYGLFECSIYEETDPQIIRIKEVNQEIRTKDLLAYFQNQDQKHLTYKSDYLAKCLQVQEDLHLNINLKEYQYTLYYYDATGNLVSTVPPKGVHPLKSYNTDNQVYELEQVKAFRSGESTSPIYPAHTLQTHYKYNVLNNLIEKETPDGGKTRYKYDQLGRVICSQNAQQFVENKFSYILYDALGRAVEAGEVHPSSATNLEDIPGVTTYTGTTNPFQTWVHNQIRHDVIETVYDVEVETGLAQHLGSQHQQNLRGRISYVKYTDYVPVIAFLTSSGAVPVDKFTSYYIYSYDLHGNVKKMLQVFDHYAFGRDYKLTEYDYDLVSGNVLEVHFQQGKTDQFHHRYTYDEDNRINKVFTSENGYVWREDARYNYYAHGPLKRVEMGSSKVQGLDYAYTLQGWLKGVNSSHLGEKDLGKDGMSGTNASFATDAMAFSLHYFDGDYTTRTSSNSNISEFRDAELPVSRRNLYNGNISRMYTGLDFQEGQGASPKHVYNDYHYDQLQRITRMQGFAGNASDVYTHTNTPFASSDYRYDKMGNITSLERYKEGSQYDDLQYNYNDPSETLENNRLYQVTETNGSSGIEGEFLASNSSTYTYDHIGNLTKDLGNKIEEIVWTPSGKVKEVKYQNSCSDCDDIEFVYGPLGNRLLKIVKKGSSAQEWKYYYYALDASGNQMGHYTWTYNATQEQLEVNIQSHVLYGSDRIGVQEHDKEVVQTKATSWESSSQGWVHNGLEQGEVVDGGVFIFTSGLVNRLSSGYASDIQLFSGDYINLNFGKVISGSLNFKALTPIKLDQREVGTLVGLNKAVPVVNGFYQIEAQTSFELTPLNTTVHFTGSPGVGTGLVMLDVIDANIVDMSDVIVSYYPTLDIEYLDYLAEDEISSVQNSLTVGLKQYELKNHLGNVLSVVSDLKASSVDPLIVSVSDYMPFGMQMPGRKASTSKYKYGFQGQEKDDEIKGNGNSVNFKYRMHDPRLGRFFAVDPLASSYPWNSPYAFQENKLGLGTELEGLELKRFSQGDKIKISPKLRKVGEIEVKQLSTFNNPAGAQGRHIGLKIELQFKGNTNNKYTDIRWVQTVRPTLFIPDNVNNEPVFNDPIPSDDPPGQDKPFYYTDLEISQYKARGVIDHFYDKPSRVTVNPANKYKNKRQNIKWVAEITMVGKNKKGNYKSLGTFKYGFKFDKDGNVKEVKLRRKLFKSSFQKKQIKRAK